MLVLSRLPFALALALAAPACAPRPPAVPLRPAPTADVAAPAAPAAPAAIVERPATLDELIRIRCALDEREVFTTWTGTIYAFVPGERPRRLFDIVGMNVARCFRHEGGWHLTSRELMYYLAPGAGTVLDRWTNPWTGTELPVVHVANRLIQAELGGGAPLQRLGRQATLVLDIPLFYPNPLARDPALAADAPPDYQAGEFFALSAPAAAVVDPALATVPTMTFGWHRLGPWLPWMQMGRRPGYLVYRAHGHKVATVAELPALLRDEIGARLPLYAHAPTCRVAQPNETSWTYFARVRAELAAGARFPLPAPVDPTECP